MNFELIFSVISGLCVCIPLVIKLGYTIHNYAKEKNWSAIMAFVLEYMVEAEQLFQVGVDKKYYVMEMVEKSAALVNYKYDDEAKEKVSQMIDDICDA